MFQDSFFVPEKGKMRRALAFPIALLLHITLIAALIVIPLLSAPDLPRVEVYSAFLAPSPPPPPPPPPPAKRRSSSKRKTRIKPVQAQTTIEPGKLIAPIEIPDEITEEDLADIGIDGGIDGGVKDGVIGGFLSGIVGGVLGDVVSEVEAPLRVGGETKPPRLVKKVEPLYPEIARQARKEGTVIIEATTDIYGRVQNVKVLRSIPLLDQAAIDAVRQWVYEPMVINGRPRGVIFTVTVKFRLK